jgi:predicted solute-binding protein
VRTIAAGYNTQRPGWEAVNESYLRENVVFTLGEEEVAGLREFYRRAFALSLIPRVPELRFHADA